MEQNEKAKELASQITDYVNRGGRQCGQELAMSLSLEHRTLQQGTMKIFLQFIELAAGDDYSTDGRNEATKDVAKKLVRGFVKELSKERNLSEDEIYQNWEVYKPSNWLPLI